MENKSYSPSVMVLKFTNDKVPLFVEPRKQDRVKFVKYGENNDYPNFLLTLFNRSAKHNAIITSKQSYIKGRGWYFDETGMDGEQVASLKAFIDAPNQYESLDDLLDKTVLDEEIFGGFYIHGINKKSGGFGQIFHMDYSKVRSNETNTEFYISDHWFNSDGSENTNIKPEDYTVIPLYDPNKKQKEWIFYYKSYRPGLSTYTLPEYIGAVPAIITDAEIANFHRAEIQNSFKGSKMIIFKNGVPSDEEMKTTKRKLEKQFAPTDAAGQMVIDFVDDPMRTPEILDLDAGNFAEKYEALNKTIQEEIFVGHKIVSPMLFGVRVEGQLGGRNEMVDAFNLFQNTYVTPRQDIQAMVYDYFAPVKGKLKIKPIEPIMPSFSEATLEKLLSVDEMRSIIGRKPMEQGMLTVAQSQTSIKPVVQPTQPAQFKSCRHEFADDEIDYQVFSKYGEPIENFVSVKHKKFMFSKEDFISKLEQGILDILRKSPDTTIESLVDIMKVDKTKIESSIETLIGDGLLDENLKLTNKGLDLKIPTFEELYIRYRYVIRPDAPALLPGGESRSFCKAMIENPRYFSREDIDNISEELGQIYGIPNYDAFKMRGGWYHDPIKDVNVPYCIHVFQQELVKKVK
jgi:hypothetical protein